MVFFALASCTPDAVDGPVPTPQPGEEVEVVLNWSISGLEAGDDATRAAMAESLFDPLTRTIPDDMKSGGAYSDETPSVENMWIIQFDGNTPASRMLGVPRFISREELPVLGNYPLQIHVPMVSVATTAYTLFVANIREGNDYRWNLTSESTFSDVVSRVKSISNESQSWEDFLPGKTLLMSAVVESPVVLNTDLNPVFKRNIAKVTLDLTLDPAAAAAGVEIVSVRMRSVQRNIVYADAALEKAKGITGSTKFPVDATLIDYAPEATTMTTAGERKTFSWYVPRNQQGVSTAPATPGVKDKSGIAPRNATCFEVTAVKRSGGNIVTTNVFRVYPGANMTDDFNIEGNHHYTVGLTVKDVGIDPADTRVETYPAIVDYTGNGTPGSVSNSFIVNPAPAGNMTRQYRIPIDQVNRYWGEENAALPGYGNNTHYVIRPGDGWAVDLVWSDLDGLYGGTGITLDNNNGIGAGMGQGPDQYFVLNVPADLPGAGNFVLGIKKTSGDDHYLWSWHFWVTDYNPYKFKKTNIRSGTYTYPVPGGQVERYASPASGTDVWATTYADDVLMDRSLGAVETYFTTNVYSNVNPYNLRGLLYYQYGRKDPFPATTDPGPNHYSPAEGPVTIAHSVSYPWAFHTTQSGNWTTDVIDYTYLWNDPKAVSGIEDAKSIYDPCPPGWVLPVHRIWEDFSRKDSNGRFINTLNPLRDLGWSYGRGMGSELSGVNGIRYWPGITGNEPAEGRIWYPATGRRNNNDGALGYIRGNYHYYYAANATSATNAGILYFDTSSVSTSGTNRGHGLPVRCISQ